MSHKRPFVDYYTQNSITPVSQDISDIEKHFCRRSALYKHLGIVPAFLKDKMVIEFGAGQGHNALFTLSCQPRKYVFVDGNLNGLKATQKRVEEFKYENNIDTDFEFYNSFIEDFDTQEKFDLVCCEGLLPAQVYPERLLNRVVRLLQGGG